MFEETQVPGIEVTYVVDSVAEHDHSLDTQSEGKAGVKLGIVAAVGED